MSEPTQSQARRRLPFGRGCIFIPMLLVLVLMVIGGVWLFSTSPQEITLGPVVNIFSPGGGSLAEINVPVLVQVSASYPAGIRQIELYADGVLVDQTAETVSGGSNPMLLDQPWTPLTTGAHILVARGYAGDGQFTDSSIVYVTVVDLITPVVNVNIDSILLSEGASPLSLNDIATYGGLSLETLFELNPALSGSDPGAPLPPGTELTLPRTPASPAEGAVGSDGVLLALAESRKGLSLAMQPMPPPVLTASRGCSAVDLEWSPSPNVTGYVVNRLALGQPHFYRTPLLPANQTTYRDQPPPFGGDYLYQVAAVNAGGEPLSNMVRASRPSSGCSPLESLPYVPVQFISLTTAQTFDGVYCYFSLQSSPDRRFPSGDFNYYEPDASGQFYNLQRDIPPQAIADLPDSASLSLRGECRGMRGSESLLLGSFTASHPLAERDGRDLVANGSGFTLHYRLGPNTSTGIVINCPIPCGLPVYNGPRPINLRIESSRDACGELIEPPNNNDVPHQQAVLGCVLLGMPTLLWDYDPPGGALIRFDIEATSTDLDGNNPRPLWQRSVSRRATLTPTAGLPCGSLITYVVTAIVPLGPGATDVGFGRSDPLSVETAPCRVATRVNVIFDTLMLGPINDCCEPDRCIFCPANADAELEVFGFITVNDRRRDLLGPQQNAPHPTRANTRPVPMTAGTYRWEHLYLASPSDSYGNWQFNSFGLIVTDPSQTFVIAHHLDDWNPRLFDMDWNPATGTRFRDALCQGAIVFTGAEVFDWQNHPPDDARPTGVAGEIARTIPFHTTFAGETRCVVTITLLISNAR